MSVTFNNVNHKRTN